MNDSIGISIDNVFESEKILSSDSTLGVTNQESPLESALNKVPNKDINAKSFDKANFQFRDLLTNEQRESLSKRAPEYSLRMINDTSAIINFGSPVLESINTMSKEILSANSSLQVPEADNLVNDLLRALDGYGNKYRNVAFEKAASRLKKFFRGTKYSLTTMVRDAKPITEKLELAENQLKTVELTLEKNVAQAEKLREKNNETLKQISGVLAALEAIIEATRNEHLIIVDILKDVNADSVELVEYKGKAISSKELEQLGFKYAEALNQMEQSWLDWRQQFFIGYGQAPSVVNIALVSASMQRRCQVFRTMGIPSARSAIGQWQTAWTAKQALDMGESMRTTTNKIIQESFTATAEIVTNIANASQTPLLDEKTIISIVDSITKQCRGLIEADKKGREIRQQNLTAIQNGESVMKTEFQLSREGLSS